MSTTAARPISLAFARMEIMYGYTDGYVSLPSDLQEHCRDMVAQNRKVLIDADMPRLSEVDRNIIEHALKCFDEDCARIFLPH